LGHTIKRTGKKEVGPIIGVQARGAKEERRCKGEISKKCQHKTEPRSKTGRRGESFSEVAKGISLYLKRLN